jgi:hypothetical protein
MRRFRSSAPKAKNGFVVQENCFVARGRTKQHCENPNDFNQMQPMNSARDPAVAGA